MSFSRTEQLAANQKKIDAQSKINHEKFVAKAAAANTNLSNTVQSKTSNWLEGTATKQAQQALSDKYGIPTFDIQGFISTVPSSGIINKDIPVGTGAFTPSAFNQSLEVLTGRKQNQITPFNQFVDVIVKPVTDIFNDFFVNIQRGDLSETDKAELDRLDAEEKYQMQIAATGGDYSIRSAAQARVTQIRIEREKFLKKAKLANNAEKLVKDEIEKLNAIGREKNFTAEIRVRAQDVLQHATDTINKITSEGVNIPSDLLKDYSLAVRFILERLKEPVTVVQNNINGELGIIENFMGLGAMIAAPFQLLADGFNLLVNPDVKTLTRFMKNAQAAQLATAKGLDE